jgi:superfamily I DNA and/or RNA helicase
LHHTASTGGTVILLSATESGRAYLLASCEFLLDHRRLTMALSRAKCKMILVASRIFSLFSTDEETFANSLLWKNLLLAREIGVVGGNPGL